MNVLIIRFQIVCLEGEKKGKVCGGDLSHFRIIITDLFCLRAGLELHSWINSFNEKNKGLV